MITNPLKHELIEQLSHHLINFLGNSQHRFDIDEQQAVEACCEELKILDDGVDNSAKLLYAQQLSRYVASRVKVGHLGLPAKRQCMAYLQNNLTEVKGHLKVKRELMIQMAAKLEHNPDYSPPLVLFGPPGHGKSALAKAVAGAWQHAIGMQTGRTLAHNLTLSITLGQHGTSRHLCGSEPIYVNAAPGALVRQMQLSGSRALVCVLDELDKANPQEQNMVATMLDANGRFMDNYLSLPVDLRQVFFIIAYNDPERLQPHLRNRLQAMAFDVPQLHPEEVEAVLLAHFEKGLGDLLLEPLGYATLRKLVGYIGASVNDETGMREKLQKVRHCLQLYWSHACFKRVYDCDQQKNLLVISPIFLQLPLLSSFVLPSPSHSRELAVWYCNPNPYAQPDDVFTMPRLTFDNVSIEPTLQKIQSNWMLTGQVFTEMEWLNFSLNVSMRKLVYTLRDDPAASCSGEEHAKKVLEPTLLYLQTDAYGQAFWRLKLSQRESNILNGLLKRSTVAYPKKWVYEITVQSYQAHNHEQQIVRTLPANTSWWQWLQQKLDTASPLMLFFGITNGVLLALVPQISVAYSLAVAAGASSLVWKNFMEDNAHATE